MKKLFGTDGMRGEAGVFPLDAETAYTVGASLTVHLQEQTHSNPRIVLGRDTRESGEWLANALVQGVLSAGGKCFSAGVITTPGVAFLTRSLPADAGVVISASHNEYKDNGIKIFSPSGKKLEEATERQIESDIYKHRGTQPTITRTTVEDEKTSAALRDKYFSFLLEQAGNISLEGKKIVIDCANGASSEMAPKLFRHLNAELIAINCAPDGRNINLNCGSLHVDALRARVVDERANFGVAFDGDADRSLFVDETGTFVDGDATLWVLANYLHDRGELARDTVVATVMSNFGLEAALRNRGLRLVRTDVGDKYVLDELLRSGATLGGEQSGHIILPRISLAGDGMLTSLFLLKAVEDRKSSLHQLTAGMERYPQVLVNVKVREKRPFSDVPAISEIAKKTETELGETGRLLLRYSGTEALARIMIEGEDQQKIEQQAQAIADVIHTELGAL